ncbi:galactose mutarotase-like domain-containing protein [Powellomyces hirtus]|nr:galactose mutarotase-like domain-containing protein [Powellomyces hirtus]
MTVTRSEHQVYELQNDTLCAQFTSYGAILTHLFVTDKNGVVRDVVLGFDTPEEYVAAGQSDANPYFGATVGRTCNRITEGKFTLNGRAYQLPVNNGPHSLHGGIRGFDKREWTATQDRSARYPALKFTYTAADGEEGYPGEVTVTCTYTLRENELWVDYTAQLTDNNPKDLETIIGMTNHTYFNLSGCADPTIVDHVFESTATGVLRVTDTQVPTGEIIPITKAAPFDFTRPKTFAAGLEPHHEHVKVCKGYDHFLVLPQPTTPEVPIAKLSAPSSGISVTVGTDAKGVQLYTGNFLDSTFKGKKSQPANTVYVKHAAVCLETSGMLDAVNHPEWRSGMVLGAGKVWTQSTVYRFHVASA